VVGNRRGRFGAPGFPTSGVLVVAAKVPKPNPLGTMDTVLALVLSLAVVYDLRERRIPNALAVGGLIAALVLRLVTDPALATQGLQGAGLGMAVAIPLFAIGALGAGDGKLLIAVGAFLGIEGLPIALLATAITGGIMSGIVSWRSGVIIPALLHTKNLLLWCVTLGRAGERRRLAPGAAVTVPFAPAIAAGTTLACVVMGAAA